MKKPMIHIFSLLVLSFLIWPAPGFSKDYIQTFKNGKIDWSNGVAEAVANGSSPKGTLNLSQARTMARIEAISSARLNLLEIINGIQVESKTCIKDLSARSKTIREGIYRLLINSRLVDIEFKKDGSVMAKVAMEVIGPLAELVLPKTIVSISPVKQLIAPNIKNSGHNTGLVVDCRGFKVETALAPRIVDEDGKVVYGSAYVSRDYAIKRGMAGYLKDLESALSHSRIGPKPFVFKGLRTAKTGLSDIVISNADSAKIRGTASNLGFLKRCRIIIVLD
jgi:hypothetical protein